MRDVIKIVSVFVGVIIGAGFASGQELLTFFAVYGGRSFYGIILCCAFFTLTGLVIMCKTHQKGITSFDGYFADVCGKQVLIVVKIIIAAFMLCTLSVMFAAGGAILFEKCGVDIYIGSFLTCAITYVILIYGVSGVVRANTVMSPVLVVGMLFFALYVLYFQNVPALAASREFGRPYFESWYSRAVIYASYNTITLSVILTSLHKYIKSKSTAVWASLLSGGVLCGIMSLLLMVVFMFYNDAGAFQIPFLYIASQSGGVIEVVYIMAMFLAILTTACASGHGAVKIMFNEQKVPPVVSAFLVCAGAYVFSLIGFSELVSKAYTTFGYFGLFISAMVFIDGIKYIRM